MTAQTPVDRPIAVIDLGTNSIKLIVARLENQHLEILDQYKEMLRLGSALDEHLMLSQASILRTVETIHNMQTIAAVHAPVYRIVATHACRLAKNRHVLFNSVYERTGLDVELIDGLEEARLIGLGMQHGLGLNQVPYFGVDCGGGSTELAMFQGLKIHKLLSLDLGVVRLHQRFLTSASGPTELAAMDAHILAKVRAVSSHKIFANSALAIASSATAKIIATLSMQGSSTCQANTHPDLNRLRISSQHITTIENEIRSLGCAKKIAKFFRIDHEKARLLIPGVAVYRAIAKELAVKEWTISTYALREGVFFDTLARMHEQAATHSVSTIHDISIFRLAKRFKINQEHAEHVADLSLQIFDGLKEVLPCKDITGHVPSRDLLYAAAILHEAGQFLSFPGYHKHSLYLIKHSTMLGYSQHERHLIGLITRFQRKGAAHQGHRHCQELNDAEIEKVNALAAVLRFGVALNRTRQRTINTIGVTIQTNQNHISICIKHDGSKSARIDSAQAIRASQFLEINSRHSFKISSLTEK